MEADEDEFGDLYTDVLRPIPSSSSSAPITRYFSSPNNPSPKNNLHHSSDDEDLLYRASSPKPNLVSSHATKSPSSIPHHRPNLSSPIPSPQHIPDKGQDEKQPFSDPGPETEIRVSDVDKDLVLNEEKAEIDIKIGGLDSDPVIPGLSMGGFVPGIFNAGGGTESGGRMKQQEGGDEEEDWESDDSEDDLQIVLNDTRGPIGMESHEDEDEDGEVLVIVADGDQHHPVGEEQEWGEEAVQPVADGEKKDGLEMAKGSGVGINMAGGVGGPRIGYSNHGYHPHHSQFKYVRPGAAVAPGGAVVGGAAGQVRPPVAMGSVAGRGRGDWRPVGINKSVPALQKNFHSGFGLPVWANNSSARAFGNGLEFTLPSHKTVFDIDIDSFEEKPWRYPGVDTSDYFNFGLDEDNWKDYCKQLDQLRLEATMQSKIRVYESGRSEQDYDPDLPPELAAAAGLHDVGVENANLGKTDGGQADLAAQGRGTIRTRPQLPTGRAIQVEGGYGERLPSIDTRPPRLRDSDAIIEIVLQDSVDDDSITSNGALERPEDGNQVELKGGDHEFEVDGRQVDTEYFDQFPQTYNGRKREMVTRRASYSTSLHNNTREGDGILPFPPDMTLQCHPSSKAQTSVYTGGLFSTAHGGRWTHGTGRGRHLHVTVEHANDVIPNQNVQNRSDVHQKENTRDSVESKQNFQATSPIVVEAASEHSLDQENDMHDDGLALADSTDVEGEEITSDLGGDSSLNRSVKKQKLSSLVEQPTPQDVGSGDDLKTTHSDNSKVKSGSSRDYHKHHESVDEEVVQEARTRRTGEGKRHHDEDEYSYRRRDDYSRESKEIDTSLMVAKGREDLHHSYPHRDWDSSSACYNRAKTESFDKSNERDGSVGLRPRRDDDMHSRRAKNEEIRRREHVEDTGSRHRNKLNESERTYRDEHLHSRRRVDDGDWRGRQDKEYGPRQRERDDVLMSRHENVDEPHIRRRKDEELDRREHVDKEDVFHSYRVREDSSRRKRERDDSLDQRRREDQAREKDKVDDNHCIRHRDGSWRQREREDRQRLKQSHEDSRANQDREGRGLARTGRLLEDKKRVGNTRAKDEPKGLGFDKDYQVKDKRRELLKRRDRVDDETESQHRGHDDNYERDNQLNNEDRNLRYDRSSTQNDRSVNAPDSERVYRDRHKENTRKTKEFEGGGQNMLVSGKRKLHDHSAHRNEKGSMKGINDQESSRAACADSNDHSQSKLSTALSKKGHNHYQHEQHEASQRRHSSRRHGEDADSDDEQQQNSRRGRSKLERWTSHKESVSISGAQSPSSSSKGKETGRNNDRSLTGRLTDVVRKKNGDIATQNPFANAGKTSDLGPKDVDMVAMYDDQHVDSERVGDDRHLDTVAKLKKRSERFKLPMPSEKDIMTNKKVENHEILLTQSETAAADTQVKQERPARKRRWVSS